MNLVKYKTGLIVGAFFALCHLLWLVIILTGVAQVWMDWILKLHMLNNPFLIQPFDYANAGLLLVVTFVVGFVVGWIIALLCNLLHKR